MTRRTATERASAYPATRQGTSPHLGRWAPLLPAGTAVALAWVSAAARTIMAMDIQYWTAPLAAVAFAATQLLLPGSRISRARLLSPANWLVLVFFVQLVVLPHVIEWAGPEAGVLPRLPLAESINHAVLLVALAFFAFSAALHFSIRRSPRYVVMPARAPSRIVSFALVGLGLAGIMSGFGSLSGFVAAVRDPVLMYNLREDRIGTFRGAAATFLKPLLALGIAMMWSHWLDGEGRVAGHWARRLMTAAACVFVALAGLSLGFNRAALLVPMIAIVAAYYWARPRVRILVLAIAAAVVIGPAVLMGAYRATQGGETTFADAVSELDLNSYFQIYAMAPQFPAYFMERVEYSGVELGPDVLVNSALSPVPILGKGVRERSGTAIYNRLVYGSLDAADQISPFIAEVTLSTGIVAMVLAYLALGWGVAKLERQFVNARTSFAAFSAQYVAVWSAFLVIGSLSSFTQVVIYFFWPLCLISVGRRLSRVLSHQ